MNAPSGNIAADNFTARQMVLASAVNRIHRIGGFAEADPRGKVYNIQLRNVGLIKRVLVEFKFTLAQAAAETLTRTEWGPANILKQAIFTDLSNYTRINTAGWHLHAVASARRQRPFGAAYTTDTPLDMAAGFASIKSPASITAAQTISMIYEIPIAYSDTDLRGSIYAAVVSANMNLQLTINNFVVGSAANGVQAAYKSSTAGDIGLVTGFECNVYQHYLDQLPSAGPGKGFIVPVGDISVAYLLNNTAIGGLVANSDNPIQYANHRKFMSTTLIYDNAGTLNYGTDISRFALESANMVNFWDLPPNMISHQTRNILGNDMPKGSYYFDHRGSPIDTVQYGNMQLLVKPSTVTSNASQFLVGWEAMSELAAVSRAGSLQAG